VLFCITIDVQILESRVVVSQWCFILSSPSVDYTVTSDIFHLALCRPQWFTVLSWKFLSMIALETRG